METIPMAETPANENVAVGLLRKAIDAPSTADVQKMIEETILNFHAVPLKLMRDDKVERELPEKPRHFLFAEILQTSDLDIPVALIGPAGSGKSTVCMQIADALGLKYYLQNSVTGTHELAGYMDAHGKYNTTAFREAFEKGGYILVDEVDTSDPTALKWVNTALANGYAMFPDRPDPVFKHKDFRIAIAANTYGNGADRIYVGANQLDASTLDRFVFFDFRYDEKMEKVMSGNIKWAERVQTLRKSAFKEKARMVISPRATIYGARLLAGGFDQKTVEERVIWKGTDEELKTRILKGAGDNTAIVYGNDNSNPTRKKKTA